MKASVLSGFVLALAALGAVWPPSILAREPPPPPLSRDARIEAVREAWEIPGLAVAILHGDSLEVRGYGVRELGRPEPVDGHTLFAIGSTTKAFTAAAVGILVEEGRLDWDDRVVDRLPGFALADPWVTRRLTIRDLLAHRSGLPMANLMWLTGLHDREELIRRLRWLDSDGGYRDGIAYQNVLYAAAGSIVEEVAGVTWEAFVRERILAPLGMEATRTGLQGLVGAESLATPQARVDGEVEPVPYRDIEPVGPAGSLLSSASDLARWLRLHLTAEESDERPVSAAILAETHRPQTVMSKEPALAVLYPRARSLTYGMGWVVSAYAGRTLLDHGGGIDGMTALVALVPEEEVGVAILANRQLPAPPYWILYDLLDDILGLERTDWSARFQETLAGFSPPPGPVRLEGTSPSLRLDRYVGSYTSPVLGEAEVARDGDGLTFRLGSLAAPLEHWHLDTFRAPWSDRAWRAAAGPGWVTFRSGRDGAIEALVLEAVPGETWELHALPAKPSGR